MKASVEINYQSSQSNIPTANVIERWVNTALSEEALPLTKEPLSVSIKIVDEKTSQTHNLTYRQQNKPTNVLSFPTDALTREISGLLGDLLLCAPIIESEANHQAKPVDAHWAHMVIHGTLHLLGYDHQTPSDAEHMESKEIHLLSKLGYDNPYKENP